MGTTDNRFVEGMPLLDETFAFSQSSLQSYINCPRRFWLAYVQRLPWPAIEAAPIQDHEHLMRLGATFHRLVERAEIGMDPAVLAAGLEYPLDQWFDAYQQQRPLDLPAQFVEVEYILSIPFGLNANPTDSASSSSMTYRLAAKYDLVAAEENGRVVIIDWKTNRRRSDPLGLQQRLQTIVYPYVMVEASQHLPWGPIQPEQVEMRYWFVAEPGQPVIFRYDSRQHATNHARLQQVLADILAGQTEADFPKVADNELNRKRFCNYCAYRSKCNRGLLAGELDELDDEEEFFVVDVESALEFTLDDVGELAF